MFRFFCSRFRPNLNDIIHRLDSIERQIIELKAFRQAVCTMFPEVESAAVDLAKERENTNLNVDIISIDPLSSDEFVELNQFYAHQIVQSIPLRNLAHIGNIDDLFGYARTVHRECLVRIAQIVRALYHASLGLSQMPSVQQLCRCYEWSFHDVKTTKVPTNPDDAIKFDTLFRRLFLRHYNVSVLLSEGMQELGQREKWNEGSFTDKSLSETFDELQLFFDNFCMSRVRLRFLVGNYIQLSTQILNIQPKCCEKLTGPIHFDHTPGSFVGQLCRECSLVKLVECVIRSASNGGEGPKIELQLDSVSNHTFLGIPYIIFDILSALFDDAIQANFSRQEKTGIPCSTIVVTVAQSESNKQLSVRISDTAGGMPLHEAEHALRYWSIYRCTEDMLKNSNTWIHSPIRLPYAYCAARVLGGDISVISVDGYGTDRFLYLPSDGIERIQF
ncbi:putative Mitochondrial branched chain alpha ketoacid dehydrogenase kinase [Trypanosoma vivax]|nr:putative pyruvate dehydrogenase (lipoamide) kinase [Trypanosoma vivax]KAH8606308.1 putative Mitochondrial branched chain alpha ketoacid dehydrogenase kinase [Trypanosoma vivax]